MKLLVILGLLLSPAVYAKEFKPLEIKHFSIEAWGYGSKHDPYQPDLTNRWTNGGAFLFDLQFLNVFSWENRLNVHGAQNKVMNVGWEYDFALNISKHIQPFWYHHSEHSADVVGATKKYPLEDRYGIRFCAIGCDK